MSMYTLRIPSFDESPFSFESSVVDFNRSMIDPSIPLPDVMEWKIENVDCGEMTPEFIAALQLELPENGWPRVDILVRIPRPKYLSVHFLFPEDNGDYRVRAITEWGVWLRRSTIPWYDERFLFDYAHGNLGPHGPNIFGLVTKEPDADCSICLQLQEGDVMTAEVTAVLEPYSP